MPYRIFFIGLSLINFNIYDYHHFNLKKVVVKFIHYMYMAFILYGALINYLDFL